MGCVGYNLRARMALAVPVGHAIVKHLSGASWVKIVSFRLQPMPGREAMSSSAGSVVSRSGLM
jgi:hypothetical protein